MKKLYSILALVLFAVSTTANAQHGSHHYRHYHQNHGRWIAPLVIGAGVTYILTRPNPEPAVIVQPAPGTQTPIVLQPGQRIVCNSSYQVYSSRYGAYETKQDCWIQQN